MDKNNPILKKLNFLSDAELQEEVFENAQFLSVNKGDVIVKEGQYVKFLPIVLEGTIRVYQQKEEREILLYHVRAEETCTMSLAAAYFNNKSSSHGVAIEPTEMLVFPSEMITKWQLKYPSWNKYVMRMFRSRYDELINSFEQIAFEHINVRVLEYLRKKCETEAKNTIHISHQNLAHDLGTTRVVVSRILKQFEREKKIKLFRGAIQLL